MALLLLLVIVPLALRANPSPPPQIAEFNPSEQQIKEAPPDQSTAFGLGGQGSGSGGSGSGLGGELGANPLTALGHLAGSPFPLDASRVRHCVGNPPRQTEDPQSPPCVSYFFEGDNGGATAKGVTRDEIVIAYGELGQPKLGDEEKAYEKYFNSRFEFYGRKLKLVPFTPGATSCQGCYSGGPDPTVDSTAAVMVGQQIGAFAAVNYPARQGKKSYFYNELKRQGVIGIDADGTISTVADYTANQPYQWNYYPAWDTDENNMVAWICSRLVGPNHDRLASFTQAPLSGTKRRFGLVVGKYADKSTPDFSVLQRGLLGSCGTSLVVSQLDYSASSVDFQNSVALMQHPTANPVDPSVTTILCFCEGGVEGIDGMYHLWIQAASNAGFFPEYIVDHVYGQDRAIWLAFDPPCDNQFGVACSPTNRNHTFGMLPDQKYVDVANLPCYYTAREADPSVSSNCATMESGGVDGQGAFGYHALLLLAAGIQTAGKILTPQTFQEGLFRTVFSNPDCAGPPLYQSCVGFGGGSHSMAQDYVETWASSNDPSNDTNGINAGYCYGSGGDLGPRYHLGNWPTAAPSYFVPPCGNH
jgi:hypothetical protein